MTELTFSGTHLTGLQLGGENGSQGRLHIPPIGEACMQQPAALQLWRASHTVQQCTWHGPKCWHGLMPRPQNMIQLGL
jgi:hypothetical protein